jgi:hypothetical protein
METRWRREHFVLIPLPWEDVEAADDIISALAREQSAS